MAQVKDSQFYTNRVAEPATGCANARGCAGAGQPGAAGAGRVQPGESGVAGAGAAEEARPGVGEGADGLGARLRSQGEADGAHGFRAPGYDVRMGNCLQRARESLHVTMPTRPQLIAIAVLMCACVVLGLVAFGGMGGHEVVIERGSTAVADSGEGAGKDVSAGNAGTAESSADSGALTDGAAEAGESAGMAVASDMTSDAASETHICIYITGEVYAPAVYDLPEGSRVADAIEAAGGATAQANLNAINLAKQLSDSEMVYVPSCDDENVTEISVSENVSQSSGGLVNINTAGLDELKTLSGIGDSLAQAIIDEREKNGPFSSVEDLVRVSGIGAKKLARFSDKVCV